MTAVGLRWRIPCTILDMLIPAGVFVGLAYLNWLPGQLWRIPENWFWPEWWLHRALETPRDFLAPFAVALTLGLVGHFVTCLNLNISRLLGIRIIFKPDANLALQITLRILGVIRNLLSLGLGYFWIFIHPRRLGWHDLISESHPRREPP